MISSEQIQMEGCDEREVIWTHSATVELATKKQEISLFIKEGRGEGRKKREGGVTYRANLEIPSLI